MGRVYSLAYADDIVLMAEKENEIRAMLEKLEGYSEGKNLELNVSKIMKRRRRGGRVSRRFWYWKGKRLEEVGSLGIWDI